MAAMNGKLTSKTPTNYRKGRAFVKRSTAKLSRRLGKRLLDGAPARITKGWAD